ncbi:MAG: ABC transporter permease [Lachnospiraceae bacterium]
MEKLIYHIGQTFRIMIYKKKYYCLILVASYIGLLLPIFCLANIRSVGQIFKYTSFEGIENSVTIDWFSKSFDLTDTMDIANASVSAQFRENFTNWNNQYVTIKGIDSNYFYQRPELVGRDFRSEDYEQGRQVCIIGNIDAKNHQLRVGDDVKIQQNIYQIIGVFTDPKVDTIMVPYKAMRNTYQNTEKVQFSGCFLYDNSEQGEEIINNITKEIKQKSIDAELLYSIEGREILEGAIQSRAAWRQVRILFMVASCLFFVCNEAIVLTANMEREKKKIAIQLAMGAEMRAVKTGYLIETLLIALAAATAACASLMPLARFFSLESAVTVDKVVISISILGSVMVYESMIWLILRSMKSTQISTLLLKDAN